MGRKFYKIIKYTPIILVSFLSNFVVAQQSLTSINNNELLTEPVQIINSEGSEMSPFFVDGNIYFSAIPQKYLTPKRIKNNTAFYTIYSAPLNENGEVVSGRKIVAGFGGEFHEGPADYCEKTGELFITVSDVSGVDTEDIEEKVRLRLLVIKFVDGKWQNTEDFPYNNENYNLGHPAINSTGDTLIFSSDADTVNYGKSDLFMSVRENDEWSVPVNLGEYINTPGNELFPTFLPGGYLSFATNGRTIKSGGLDIYYVAFPELSEVKIFRNEINSPFDDFGLRIYPNGKTGYFTSDRNQERSDDIFSFELVEQETQ